MTEMTYVAADLFYVPQIPNVGKWICASTDIVIENPDETSIGAFPSIGHQVHLGNGSHPQGYFGAFPTCTWTG